MRSFGSWIVARRPVADGERIAHPNPSKELRAINVAESLTKAIASEIAANQTIPIVKKRRRPSKSERAPAMRRKAP